MLKNCDWCGNDYDARVSYQIYCSVECRTIATREKSVAKQREKKIKSRVGKTRNCTTCEKPLSVYNDENFCSSCIGSKKDYKKFLRNIK